MKELTLILVASTLLSPVLRAQRGGMAGGGSPGFRPSMPYGHPSGRPFVTGFRPERSAYTSASYASGGWGYPSYYSDEGFGPAYSEPPQAPQLVIIAPPAPPPPPPPPEPVRPVTHGYSFPTEAYPPAEAFAVVWRDGSVRYASAVWVQEGGLHYTQTDGTQGIAPLNSIDTEATRRLNAENRLKLSLPLAAPPSQ